MKQLLAIAGLLVGMAAPSRGDDAFSVFAPSRTTGKLLIVSATPRDDGLKLALAREVELGFEAATIAPHRSRPVLYVAAARGPQGSTPGALVSLDRHNDYQSHQAVRWNHGYSYLSLDRTGRFLLGANYFDGHVDIYSLDPSGLAAKLTQALSEGRRNAHCVLLSPDNRFAYVPYVKETNAIYQYRFDLASGTLSALSPKNADPPAGTGPRHMAYHPRLPLAYFSNEQHLGVSAYDIQPSGALALRQVCDAVGADQAKDGVSSSDIVIAPDGRYLFAGIRGHRREFDWISRYRVTDDGTLQLLGLTPADKIPWGLTLSPDGRYLLATAFQGGTLAAYKIGEQGELTIAARLDWDKNISDLVTLPRRIQSK